MLSICMQYLFTWQLTTVMSTCQWETWGYCTKSDWRIIQEDRNYSRKKRPPEELAQTLNEHGLHSGYVFQMQWRRKPLDLISFRMRHWDSSSTRASFSSLSAQAQHPSLRNAVHLHIASGLQTYKYCSPFTWAYELLRYLCVPSRLLRQQCLIAPHYCFNNVPPVRSDLSSEKFGN